MVEIVHITQEITLKQNYSRNYHHFGLMTSSWPPIQHFFSILSKFCRFLPIWPLQHQLSYKTMVHTTQEITAWVEQSSSWFYRIISMLWWSNRRKSTKICWKCPKSAFLGDKMKSYGQNGDKLRGKFYSKVISWVVWTISTMVL